MNEHHKHPDSMTHREKLESLSGLFLAMFVTMMSSTIVSNALPTIIGDLKGTQTQYTWIVTAALLTSTAATPVIGKLSDLFSKKLLLQISLAIFVLASVAAGFSQNTGQLIGFRALQGIGLGGVQALTQIVMAAVISPRERGKYNGYFGGVMALATIGGPLAGGAIVDSALGWRWVFFVGVPFAIWALLLLQKTLHIPVIHRDTKVDYMGAVLITSGVSVLLVWVTFAGRDFDWISGRSAMMFVPGALMLVASVFVELRAPQPIIPLQIVVQRTPLLAIIASLGVGISMFGGSVFLGQYFQIARDYSPTAAGLLMIPMMFGIVLSSTIGGKMVSKHGRWKRFVIAGSAMLAVGFAMLATMDHMTSMVFIGVAIFIVGMGVGLTMQNLVLAVQNTVEIHDIGASTSTVTFFRSMGGTIGVAVLGAMVAGQLRDQIMAGLAKLGISPAAGASSGNLDLKDMPAPIAELVRAAYGDVTGHVFLVSAVLAVMGLIAVLFIEEVPLREQLVHPKTDEEVIDTGVVVEV